MPRYQDDFTKPTGTVIGQGFTIQAGRLAGSESMRLDGTVIGDIELEGALHVSETGIIEGNIFASSARIAGRVSGNIQCRATLHLAATAVISGDIATDTIIVDNGAVFFGKCETHINDNSSLAYSSL